MTTKQKQTFRKKKTFNTSYYRRQKIDENTKHYQVKTWIGNILKEYCFKVYYEYVHPLLLAPKQIMDEKPDPYKLDILAYNEYRGEVITCEINGLYHYKRKQRSKDSLRKQIIIEWVRNYFVKIVKWKTARWGHRHVEISRDDVYNGFLDYDRLISDYLGL